MFALISYTARYKGKIKIYMEFETKVKLHEMAIYFSLKECPSVNELVSSFCNV